MKRQIEYTNEPIGRVQIEEDFLPPPDQLVLKEENVKVTIALSKSSITFFKRMAKEHRTPYQALIRHILNIYAERFNEQSQQAAAAEPGSRVAESGMPRPHDVTPGVPLQSRSQSSQTRCVVRRSRHSVPGPPGAVGP